MQHVMGGAASDEEGGLLDPSRSAECASSSSPVDGSGGGPAPAVPIKTFMSLLACYVAPLAYALAVEASAGESRSPTEYAAGSSSVGALAAWLSLQLALYAVQRRAAHAMRWKMNEKLAASCKEDLLRMSYLGALLCYAGRVGSRMDTEPLAFGALVTAFTLCFGVLFELVRHCNIEFTQHCVRNVYTILLAVFTVLIVTALAANHISLVVAAHEQGALAGAGSAGAMFAIVIGSHLLILLLPGRTHPHWHHWYTGFVGSCFCVFDTLASKIAQAMLIGIYLHGAALFGVESCFYPDESQVVQRA